jgi:hypothetical protein
VRLAAEIDRGFLAGRFGSVCRAGPGQPSLPTRLVAGLFILKHMHNLSDEMAVRPVGGEPVFSVVGNGGCPGPARQTEPSCQEPPIDLRRER